MHHNPTLGPAGSPYVYGHVFVVLGSWPRHLAWGLIALPLWPDVCPAEGPHRQRPEASARVPDQAELAVELLRWAKIWQGLLGKPLWVVADGA